MSCVVELRGAATDLLHPVVREGLATLRGALSAVGRALPRHVLNELEGFLGCGDPVNGAGLERLCRYILRPPLAKGRLQRREDGSVVVGLKRVWSDGTSALVFSPSELVERLVALVPPPRANQVIYGGVLAANAAWRAEVVPSPPPETPDAAKARRAKRLTRHPRMRLAGERPSWSDLLERVFRVDGFVCPGCGGALALGCVVVNPPTTGRILDGLRRATRPLGSTPRATTGGRDDAGPAAEPCARRGESEVSGASHQVGVPQRDGRRG